MLIGLLKQLYTDADRFLKNINIKKPSPSNNKDMNVTKDGKEENHVNIPQRQF